ncbi:hypothetical protein [Gilvibacter sediminis]|uniref:hypothetical protein n=1 Tax=Gilvibacter sediminis TaxID=379071 RepID=UPI002350506A|nr:hypothetical protein [Gilvibacter sediminis]MDC7998619.1 hypothetical protein [Gilvibacter sediminis]
MDKTIKIVYAVYTVLVMLSPYGVYPIEGEMKNYGLFFSFNSWEIFLVTSPILVLNILRLERFGKSGYMAVSVLSTILGLFYFIFGMIWISDGFRGFLYHFGILLLILFLPLSSYMLYYDKKRGNLS